MKLEFNTNIVTLDSRSEHKARALLDSGCKGSCIDVKYIREHNLPTKKLARPIPMLNTDGQPNSKGRISESISLELRIGPHWDV